MIARPSDADRVDGGSTGATSNERQNCAFRHGSFGDDNEVWGSPSAKTGLNRLFLKQLDIVSTRYRQLSRSIKATDDIVVIQIRTEFTL